MLIYLVILQKEKSLCSQILVGGRNIKLHHQCVFQKHDENQEQEEEMMDKWSSWIYGIPPSIRIGMGHSGDQIYSWAVAALQKFGTFQSGYLDSHWLL